MSNPLAAGVHALAVPGLADGFAAVLGAHRFLHNDAVALPSLIQPLHEVSRQWRRQAPQTWGLVIHDWSLLSYPGHRRKADQAKVNHGRGYELAALLLVEGDDGQPIAPLELRLRAAKAVFSTRTPAPSPKAYRIDEVLPSMQAVAGAGPVGPLVHVIDREADALVQYRAWQAAGHSFLVRTNGRRVVRWQGEEVSLTQLAGRLASRRCQEVSYQGQQAVQHVAEAEVVLDRPAWRRRGRGKKKTNERVAGLPITLRLVVSRVCDGSARTLAVWYLLTNAPAEVEAATVALWYYGRRRIETFHKLIKLRGLPGGAVAAVGRGSDRQTAGGGGDGLHAGVASGAAVVAGGGVAARVAGAAERPADEEGQRMHDACPVGGVVGAAGDDRGAGATRRRRTPPV